MKRIKDGWHSVHGTEVYTEDGKVVRGVKRDGANATVTYPYHYEGSAVWVNCSGITLAAFRSGYKRGTVDMF